MVRTTDGFPLTLLASVHPELDCPGFCVNEFSVSATTTGIETKWYIGSEIDFHSHPKPSSELFLAERSAKPTLY
jgi:hypothetical protein